MLKLLRYNFAYASLADRSHSLYVWLYRRNRSSKHTSIKYLFCLFSLSLSFPFGSQEEWTIFFIGRCDRIVRTRRPINNIAAFFFAMWRNLCTNLAFWSLLAVIETKPSRACIAYKHQEIRFPVLTAVCSFARSKGKQLETFFSNIFHQRRTRCSNTYGIVYSGVKE